MTQFLRGVPTCLILVAMHAGCARVPPAATASPGTLAPTSPTSPIAPIAPIAPAAPTAAAGPAPVTSAPTAVVDGPLPVAEGFDLAAFRADPAAYCRVVDGSRCRQVAQPGPTTPALLSHGAGAFAVRPGGRARLQVRTEPGMPATFASMGLGRFTASNQAAVSVVADAEGIASAEFEASAGTVGYCHIIVGSPVRAGTTEFIVSVEE